MRYPEVKLADRGKNGTHKTVDSRARTNSWMTEFKSHFSQKYCEIEKQHWHNCPLTSWYWVDIENNEGKLVENEKNSQIWKNWSRSPYNTSISIICQFYCLVIEFTELCELVDWHNVLVAHPPAFEEQVANTILYCVRYLVFPISSSFVTWVNWSQPLLPTSACRLGHCPGQTSHGHLSPFNSNFVGNCSNVSQIVHIDRFLDI